VNALCRALAVELAPVRVNAISPGIIETPAYAAMEAEVRQEFFDRTAAALPAGRIGRPAEVAEAVLFLMRNGFVTGAVLDIDGGGRLS
jgi:NAD(P)-dependent dehydrogenase (short-subunit alcohol dehydrogenase family)